MNVRACGVLLAAGVALLCGPACSTIATVGKNHRYLYSGTCENIHAFDPPRRPPPDEGPDAGPAPPPPVDSFRGLRQTLAFLEFPWSLALDTVLVPLTLPLEVIPGGSSIPPQEPAVPPKKE